MKFKVKAWDFMFFKHCSIINYRVKIKSSCSKSFLNATYYYQSTTVLSTAFDCNPIIAKEKMQRFFNLHNSFLALFLIQFRSLCILNQKLHFDLRSESYIVTGQFEIYTQFILYHNIPQSLVFPRKKLFLYSYMGQLLFLAKKNTPSKYFPFCIICYTYMWIHTPQ